MDAAGNFEYRYFDSYFEEDRRAAYFIYQGDELIGFVMMNDYSCLEDAIDYAIAEFTVFPRYRGRHLATDAMRQIFRAHPGKWEIKFSEQNRAAGVFWRKVTGQYAPLATPLGNAETVLSFLV